jgi:hypothetical protein
MFANRAYESVRVYEKREGYLKRNKPDGSAESTKKATKQKQPQK